MSTMQQLVDRARLPLNDSDKVTWSDNELLDYANGALETLYATRPDLFIGQFGTPPLSLAIGATFPLDQRVFESCANFVTAKAQLKDSESAIMSRASSFFELVKAGIV